ncbi:MAG: class I SAM-dependent methyltransferase [Acidobacteriota bacterium]
MTDKRFKASEAHRLDAPERLVWLPPADVVRALHLRTGETVADIGAGTGYFSLPIRRALGASGRVFAVDAQREMLTHLREKMQRESVTNIDPVHAEADATTLPDACCDLVLMANVWHEFADRMAVLHESLRILKRPGRVAILDWRPDVEREAGPPLDHRIAAATAAAELDAAGFTQIEQHNVGK